MAKQQRLAVNTHAPNFKAIAYGGNVIDTRELRGKKIWLALYRYAPSRERPGLHLLR